MKVKKLFILLLVFIMVFNTYTPVQAAKVKTVKASADISKVKYVPVGKSKVRIDGVKNTQDYFVAFKAPSDGKYTITASDANIYKGESDEYTYCTYELCDSSQDYIDGTGLIYTVNYPSEHSGSFTITLSKNDVVYLKAAVGYPDVIYNLKISKVKESKYPELFFENDACVISETGKYYLRFFDASKERNVDSGGFQFMAPADGTYKFDFYHFRCSVKGCLGKEDYAKVEHDYIYPGKDTHYKETVTMEEGNMVKFYVQMHSMCTHGAKLTLKITKVK